MLRKALNYFSISKPSLLLILLGTFVWSLVMVRSGIVYDYGMGFWGPNGHDGVWHLAMINSLARGSWEMPIFAGEVIKNYHIGFDLLVAMLHKLTFIPVTTLYFQILPPIMAFFIGLFAYKFVYSWRRSTTQAFWALFFIYFGGSFGWLVSLVRVGDIGGESMFWAQQSISTLINPPFALSLLLIFLGLDLLLKGVRYKNKKRLVAAAIIFGLLIQIKVYAGLLVLGSLFVSGLYLSLTKRDISVLKVFSASLVVSLLVFLPLNNNSQSVIIFKPFWFLDSMMGSPDRFYWPRYAEALANYKSGGVVVKGFVAYVVALLIFWVGNMGTRVVKIVLFGWWILKGKKYGYVDVLVVSIILSGLIIPMLFVQKANSWNTIQFFYYSLMFSGILTGVVLGEINEKLVKRNKTKLFYVFAVLVILFTIPTTFASLRNFLPPKPQSMLPNDELDALTYLTVQPKGVVMGVPFDKAESIKALSVSPRPLYLYESTSYLSAFSGKPVYFEDELNLEITDYDWKQRRMIVEEVLSSSDSLSVFMNENNISYLYLVKDQISSLSINIEGLNNIFENDSVLIYSLN